MSTPYLDLSVYPDVDPSELPERLDTDAQKADYVERICSSWDFDVYPEPATFALLRDWKTVFDNYPLAHSPAYHTFRRLFGWEDVPFEKNDFVRLTHEVLDRAEGRGPDPCFFLV